MFSVAEWSLLRRRGPPLAACRCLCRAPMRRTSVGGVCGSVCFRLRGCGCLGPPDWRVGLPVNVAKPGAVIDRVRWLPRCSMTASECSSPPWLAAGGSTARTAGSGPQSAAVATQMLLVDVVASSCCRAPVAHGNLGDTANRSRSSTHRYTRSRLLCACVGPCRA